MQTSKVPCLWDFLLLALVALQLAACQGKSGQSSDRLELAAEQERLAEQALADKEAEATRRRQAEEAARKAHEEEQRRKEAARSAEQRHEDCCVALARRGFEERSEPDMAAKKICRSALAEKEPLAEIQQALSEALDGRPLPPGCSASGAPH